MKKRVKFFKTVIIIIFIILLGRVFQLQIIQGEQYYRLAENNRISIRPVSAPRGRIYSSDGSTLVSNKLSYNLYFQPNELPPGISRDDIFNRMANTTDYNREELENYYQRGKERSSPGEGILIKRNLNAQEMVRLEENRDILPGINVREAALRDYVYNNTGSHIFGYVGEIGMSALQNLTEEGFDYSGGDIIGITGLERKYESYLKGEKGFESIQVNHLGHRTKLLDQKDPEPGHDLLLNINWDLQQYIEKTLAQKFSELQFEAEEDDEISMPQGASAIVMEVDTGKILSMVSYPDFNPNDFAEGFRTGDYNQLVQDSLKPLLNRNIMITESPGSIFKLITATAAVENLDIKADTRFVDSTGRFNIPGWGRAFTNWLGYGEGEMTFTRAMARSNNIIFYELGYELYEEYSGSKLVETAREFGLGSKTGIDLPEEKAGLVPDGQWKRETKGEGWYPGDSVNMSIGQGDLLITPIQAAQMTSAVANRGEIYKPKIVDEIRSDSGELISDYQPELMRRLPYSNTTFEIVEKGMLETVMHERGTASTPFSDFPIDIAGKTGTAQIGGTGSSHAWFVSYGPVPDPEIVIVIFIDQGETSSNAVPIAADIYSYYYDLFPEDTENENGE
ncbi:MAG: penicillin-binding protein 2 [Halarsenatibacteraceae bacterium]